MLYKPGKPQAGQANGGPGNKANQAAPPPAQKPHQHNHMWHRLGQILSSAISLFGSHQHLDKSLSEGSGSQAREDQQPQQSHQPQHQFRRQSRHNMNGASQQSRPTAAVSCQDLTCAPATFNRCVVVDLTFSDDEDGQHGANRVAKWATGLGHLLGDSDGVSVFAEFLRSEFSEENINFWLSVEEFKRLIDPVELLIAAQRIGSAHIGCDTPASVNLDGATVHELQGRLGPGQPPPQPGLFDSAQEHIFNLMRQDSYARFLKSSLYKDCLLCELKSRPLPKPSAEPSLYSSEISLEPQQPGLSQKSALFSASFLHPSMTGGQTRQQQQLPRRRSRKPSFIVAALDLDCEFSDC